MQEYLEKIKNALKIIGNIEEKYKIKRNADVDVPLLYCGVAQSNIIKDLSEDVKAYFSDPYKPAGKSAFLKNFFDKFMREVGGARVEQTLYRLQISEKIFLYCAFWPWGSNPVKTSIRIGLICYEQADTDYFSEKLKDEF
ncbi:MAG: hypothetical protein PHF29_07130 [Candidatus Riflebacteria bacterium]|nr:hypothetical protein [Candidatus Riflebacteria bacterium]